MRLSRRTALVTALLGYSSVMRTWHSAAAETAESSFQWPLPAGWRKETIPFPLGFAPALKYRGVEELRFMPGIFDPKAPDFWSYSFAWWLEGSPAPDTKSLQADLTRYFAGLCQAVGGTKFRFDPQRFSATLRAVPRSPAGSDPSTRFEGTIDLYDAFVTGKPIRLAVKIRTLPRAEAKRRVILFTARPVAVPGMGGAPAEVAAALEKCAAAFECK